MRQVVDRMAFNVGKRAGTVALAALVAAAVAPPPADANQFRRIQDVNVSCNDALRCDLFITNPSVTLFSIGFRRTAAFQAPLSLFLTLREPLSAGSELIFIIDARPVLTLPAAAFSYRAAISEYMLRDEEPVLKLLAAAASGERLQVIYQTRSGQSSAQFSLSGLVDGSVFMDEFQGRTGRDDSLEAIGEVAAQVETELALAQSQPGDMTKVAVVPAGLLRYYEGDNAPCADIDGAAPDPLDGFDFNLGEDMHMVGLRCGVAGADNIPFAFWLGSPDGRFERLALPAITAQGPAATLLAFNADWDPQTRRLSSFFTGREPGDCGRFHRWQLRKTGQGLGFVLEQMRVKDRCDGVFDETFDSWEQLWPAAGDNP